jgi:hypothetical protein
MIYPRTAAERAMKLGEVLFRHRRICRSLMPIDLATALWRMPEMGSAVGEVDGADEEPGFYAWRQNSPRHPSCVKILASGFILEAMSLSEIISKIDAEIAHLQSARRLIAGLPATRTSKQNVKPTALKKRKRQKHVMTPEGRAKIAEAQRKRWAAKKKAAK